jgi:hypothetical protein
VLVYVAENHLDELFGVAREPGRRVTVQRAKLPPQIERLDERSTLFFVTVQRVRARVVASLESPRRDGPVLGEATIHDHDITNLLARLGCPKVWQVSRWAATPRIVPPEDVQLLRYHLGLPLELDENDDAPNAPLPSVEGSPADYIQWSRKSPTTPPRPARAPTPVPIDQEAARLAELEAKLAELQGFLDKYKADRDEDERPTAPRAAVEPKRVVMTSEPASETAQTVVMKVPTTTPASAPTTPNQRGTLSLLTAPPVPALTQAPKRQAGQITSPQASVADVLLAAVFTSPASDATRREYAEHLQAAGDPRGDLIEMQLDRVERGEPISDRERELVARLGDACAEPLGAYFTSYELRRGFVWKAVMAPGVTVPEHLHAEPSWATIEDLATTDATLLAAAPLTALRRARVDQRTFETLGRSDGLVAIDTLLPYPEPGTRGIVLEPIDSVKWRDVVEGGAFVTHSLSVDACRLAGRVPQFMTSRLVRRLSHLDAWIDIASAKAWRTAFDASELPLLTLRFVAHGIEPVVAFERRDGAHRMVVELRATVSAAIAKDLALLLAGLGTGIEHIELVDTSLAPFPAQQPELARALEASLKSVELRRGDTLALV